MAAARVVRLALLPTAALRGRAPGHLQRGGRRRSGAQRTARRAVGATFPRGGGKMSRKRLKRPDRAAKWRHLGAVGFERRADARRTTLRRSPGSADRAPFPARSEPRPHSPRRRGA